MYLHYVQRNYILISRMKRITWKWVSPRNLIPRCVFRKPSIWLWRQWILFFSFLPVLLTKRQIYKDEQDAWRVNPPQFAIGKPPPLWRAVFYCCYFALLAIMLNAICRLLLGYFIASSKLLSISWINLINWFVWFGPILPGREKCGWFSKVEEMSTTI